MGAVLSSHTGIQHLLHEKTNNDAVYDSMRERVVDIWRAQGTWPFPRWENGRIVKLRVVPPPFDITKVEDAPI
jgi:hypothetical protein